MSTEPDRIAQAITRFVENPVTNLVKGMSLFVIGLSEVSKTFRVDLTNGQVRSGHGLLIIGFFGILSALPNLIEALEASNRYYQHRDKKSRPGSQPESRPESSEDQAGPAPPG